MKHLARNSSVVAQIVSSLVLVRNRCPSTPTKSPKSSSLKIAKSRSLQRVLADVDLDPRPAVGDDEEVRLAEAADRQDAPGRRRLDAARLELLAGLRAVRRRPARRWCASARRRAGTASTPRRCSSSKFARRWRICSDSFCSGPTSRVVAHAIACSQEIRSIRSSTTELLVSAILVISCSPSRQPSLSPDRGSSAPRRARR